ncbi:hypothetical protein Y032_0155g3043 [Ancylostoma ceylanicum]|uniref:Cation efflux protein cytoplasmic domain-containing protein n=1 Tax=Ancylostoma ceylanicum TaxID=53326 RepID=A0A016SZL4_9BILA|nr:hypothetical protein Y032_0155g3043 [Ancylostoma ceylanicum]
MRNDIATSLVAIVCATIGDRYWSYADPVGAILVCGLIATSWFHHAIQQVPILVGVRAERDQLSRILKIVIEHDDRIRQIHHIMVYHTGLQATVELHIVMDENLPLKSIIPSPTFTTGWMDCMWSDCHICAILRIE